MKKLATFMLLLLSVYLVAPAFAASGEDVRTGTASGGSSTGAAPVDKADPSINDMVNGVINDFAPNITTDDIVNRLETKGNDVVTILQTVGRYVCIGAFIICCILTLFGIIGNPRMLWGGVIGLIISGVAYAFIVCGREIVNWIATWAIS